MQSTADTILAQKAAGDDAFRAGELEQALEHYAAALEADPRHVPTLCNRSLAALKLGLPEEALRDAEAALAALPLEGGNAGGSGGQLAKAVHRKAEALLAMGQLIECLRVYRQGLAASPGCPELHGALRLAAEELPVPWLAKYWVRVVEAAQAPNPLSSRDGRLIRPVPQEHRLAPPDLQAHLEAALYPLQDEARDLLGATWAHARRPGRAEAAFCRAAAYLNAGNAQQAVKDLRLALVYGPQLESPVGCTQTCPDSSGAKSNALVKAGTGAGGKAGDKAGAAAEPPTPPPPPALEAAGKLSAWAAALGLLSAALESLADNVHAVMAVQRALELDPENGEYSTARERLLRRIPPACADAVQAGGAAGLEAYLAAQREEALPEFKRQRPKYYYFYEWMKKRIHEQYPALPEPVMDKLLALEANELDMVLQYPRATHITVERLMHVYETEGAEKLETYVVPLLSWDDYQAIKDEGGATLALPAGASSAPAQGGRLLEAPPASTAQAEGTAHNTGSAPQEGLLAGAQAPSAPGGDVEMMHSGGDSAGPGSSSGSAGQDEEAGVDDMEDCASEAGSVDIDELFELD